MADRAPGRGTPDERPFPAHCQNPVPHPPHTYWPEDGSIPFGDRLRCDGHHYAGTAAEELIAAHDALVWDAAIRAVEEALNALARSEWTTDAQDDFMGEDVFPAIAKITNPYRQD